MSPNRIKRRKPQDFSSAQASRARLISDPRWISDRSNVSTVGASMLALWDKAHKRMMKTRGGLDGHLVTKGMPPAGAFSCLLQKDGPSWPARQHAVLTGLPLRQRICSVSGSSRMTPVTVVKSPFPQQSCAWWVRVFGRSAPLRAEVLAHDVGIQLKFPVLRLRAQPPPRCAGLNSNSFLTGRAAPEEVCCENNSWKTCRH